MKDCDGNLAVVYEKEGSTLATASATTSIFFPDNCNEWRHETVELSEFAGQTIELEFENDGGYGNQLFIDNINISSPQIVNQAPAISIVDPIDGTIIENELPDLLIEADASDEDGTISNVSFTVNGAPVGNTNIAPYQINYLIPEYGIYTISATATDNNGAQTQSAEITISVQLTSSTANAALAQTMVVSPVPTKDMVQIAIATQQTGSVSWRLLDPLGKTILNGTWELTMREFQTSLDVSAIPAGSYFAGS